MIVNLRQSKLADGNILGYRLIKKWINFQQTTNDEHKSCC